MIPEIYISLVIEEEAVNADVLHMLSKIKPSILWQKGQFRGKSSLAYTNNGCSFTMQSVIHTDIGYALNSFWEYLEQKNVDLLKDIIDKYHLAPILSVTVYTSEIMPSIHFEQYALKKFERLNLGLDVDIILRS